MALRSNGGFGFGLAGRARQRAGGDDEADEIGALVGEPVRGDAEPFERGGIIGVVGGVIDHAGVAAVEHADQMDGIGEVAHRRDSRAEQVEMAVRTAAIRSEQRRERPPGAPVLHGQLRIQRHSVPTPIR